MPIYCFKREDDGKIVEASYSMGEQIPRFIVIGDGVKADRCFQAEAINGYNAGNWPMKSDSAGVAPSQIKEAYARSVKAGVPTEFTKDGRAVLKNREHRKRYLASIGMHDNDGGYGD